MRARVWLAACVLFGGLGLTRATGLQPPDDQPPTKGPLDKVSDKPLDRIELDQRLARIAHSAAVRGATLWKREQYEDTFWFYHGTLTTMVPLLDHRPNLAQFVSQRLTKAEGMDPIKGAFVLREALDAIIRETSEALAKKVTPKKPLWDRVGGEKVVKAVVHDFITEIRNDKKLDLTRGGKVKLEDKDFDRVEEIMVQLLSAFGGGPIEYKGPKDLTPALLEMKFTADEFDTMLRHLAAALKKNKVPDAETREVLEWAGPLKDIIVPKK